jgi:two-component system, chemotaxis family, chemotaxis protein CheY
MGAGMEQLRVLIVDDEPFMRKTIKVVLRVVGQYAVEEADDGDVALAMVPVFRPDIVLCDISMPRMGGLQFVEQLRIHQEAELRDIPVIVLTVNAEESTILTAARLKVSGYLVKPVSPKQLGAQIKAIEHNRQARSHL